MNKIDILLLYLMRSSMRWSSCEIESGRYEFICIDKGTGILRIRKRFLLISILTFEVTHLYESLDFIKIWLHTQSNSDSMNLHENHEKTLFNLNASKIMIRNNDLARSMRAYKPRCNIPNSWAKIIEKWFFFFLNGFWIFFQKLILTK